MDAATTFTLRLPDRHTAAGAARAFDRAVVAQAILARAVFQAPKIFKKTLCIAGLRPAGRDVAKHMPEVDDIPFLTNLNLKLTDKESVARPSEMSVRATNHTSTALWDDARRTARGAGGADEKRCDADH